MATIFFIAYPYIPFSIKTKYTLCQNTRRARLFVVLRLYATKLTKYVCYLPGLPHSASLFVLRTAVVAQVWYGHNQDLADLRQTIQPSEQPAARVLVVDVLGPGADYLKLSGDPGLQPDAPKSRYLSTIGFPMYWHMAALVLIERRAFWPMLFAHPSKQPLRVLEPYAELSGTLQVVFPTLGG